MLRKLAPGFVVTFAALSGAGCHESEPIHYNPPPLPVPVTDDAGPGTGAATIAAPQATRKRVRSSDAGRDWGHSASGIDYADLRPQNPQDGQGRPIYAAYDDRCFTSQIAAVQPANRPTGMPVYDTTFVDCPAAMDDPAWDTCGDTLSKSTTSGQCVCLSSGGNPPPPPSKNACPKR